MSNTTTLHFIKAGMFTTIQDLGRAGHQDKGIPVGGALDRASAHLANSIAGNAESEPVLEITMKGPLVRFEGSCQIVITGADMKPTLSDEEIPQNVLVDVAHDAVLSFDKLRSGCRAYLAVRGKWQVEKWLGSASALTIAEADLVPGAVIKKGSLLHIVTLDHLEVGENEGKGVDAWPDELIVRVLAGPEFKSFSAEQIAFFFNTRFSLTSDSNRIGYRLEPLLPAYESPSELISSGIVPGVVQVTRQGQPIILMADAQTTGGYHRIANVIREDLDRLAQLKPGSSVRFEIIKQRKPE
jgi:antagonist of KipI